MSPRSKRQVFLSISAYLNADHSRYLPLICDKPQKTTEGVDNEQLLPQYISISLGVRFPESQFDAFRRKCVVDLAVTTQMSAGGNLKVYKASTDIPEVTLLRQRVKCVEGAVIG